MDFKQENLGGLVLRGRDAYVVCGYDFINKNYITTFLLNGCFKPYVSTYNNDIIYTKETAETAYKEIKDKKDRCARFCKIYFSYCDLYGENNRDNYNEFRGLFSKMHEINKTIKSIEKILTYRLVDDERTTYMRELKKQEKGLKRRLKRLYRLVNDKNYTFMNDLLKELNYPHFGSIVHLSETLEKQEKNIQKYIDVHDTIKNELTKDFKIEISKLKYEIDIALTEAMVD